jgi:hypothetical protein
VIGCRLCNPLEVHDPSRFHVALARIYGPPFTAHRNDERNRTLTIRKKTQRDMADVSHAITLQLPVARCLRRYFLCPQLDSAAAEVISPLCSEGRSLGLVRLEPRGVRGQPRFRETLLAAYEGGCATSHSASKPICHFCTWLEARAAAALMW